MVDRELYYIVGRTSCPYCVKAKEYLASKSLEFHFRDLEDDRSTLMEYVKKYEWETVPMIFKFSPERDPEFLGGYNDMINHVEN